MVEHTAITTSREIKREGEVIPSGSIGTIVHIYSGMKACVVEFCDLPDNPVVTIYPSEIKEE